MTFGLFCLPACVVSSRWIVGFYSPVPRSLNSFTFCLFRTVCSYVTVLFSVRIIFFFGQNVVNRFAASSEVVSIRSIARTVNANTCSFQPLHRSLKSLETCLGPLRRLCPKALRSSPLESCKGHITPTSKIVCAQIPPRAEDDSLQATQSSRRPHRYRPAPSPFRFSPRPQSDWHFGQAHHE